MSDASSLRAAAEAAWRTGRLDEAIGLLEQVASLSPQDPRAWIALADAFAAANRPEMASLAWDKALVLDPAARAALIGKAKSWQAMGQPEQAAVFLKRALANAPDDFEALFAIAVLALDRGELEGAQAAATRLTGAHGDRPGALWLAARIAAARGDLERARPAVEALLRRPELSPQERAEALLLLSRILDGQSLASAAFAAAAEGKAIQRRLYAARAAGRESETDKFRRLASWFADAETKDWRPLPPAPAAPGDPAGHIFLIGFPRSGTTLIEQALAGRPDVVALEEAPTLASHYAEFLSSRRGFERLSRLSPEEATLWRAQYWRVVRDFGAEPAGRVFLDKSPAGTINMPILAKLFPEAKVLFAVRDPRDVVLSCLLNAFQMNALTYAFTTLEETVACYDACMTMADVYRRLFDLDVREVRYETLIDDVEGQFAAIAQFVGLPAQPRMADIAATARRRQVRTPSADQVRAGLTRQRLGRWRLYAVELAAATADLAPWITRFGYEDQPGANPAADGFGVPAGSS